MLGVPSAFVDPPGVVLLDGEEHRVEPGNHYRAELDDFCAAIRGEGPPLLGTKRADRTSTCAADAGPQLSSCLTLGTRRQRAEMPSDPAAAIQSVSLVPRATAAGPASTSPIGWNASDPNQS